jgi:hypothetical protein
MNRRSPLSVTSALHCLVAMAANPAASGSKNGEANFDVAYGLELIVVTVFVVAAAATHQA